MPVAVMLEATGLRARILDLPALSEVKQGTGRAQDRLVVPLLVALLRERDKQPSE